MYYCNIVTKLLSIITHSPGPLYLSPSPDPELLLMESLSTSIFATGAGISDEDYMVNKIRNLIT